MYRHGCTRVLQKLQLGQHPLLLQPRGASRHRSCCNKAVVVITFFNVFFLFFPLEPLRSCLIPGTTVAIQVAPSRKNKKTHTTNSDSRSPLGRGLPGFFSRLTSPACFAKLFFLNIFFPPFYSTLFRHLFPGLFPTIFSCRALFFPTFSPRLSPAFFPKLRFVSFNIFFNFLSFPFLSLFSFPFFPFIFIFLWQVYYRKAE